MGYLGYLKENLMAIATRKEFTRYAEENPFLYGAELGHALDVSALAAKLWQIDFGTRAPLALKGAGLNHDIERFFPKESVETHGVSEELYEAAKRKHSENCVRIFRRENPKLPRSLKDDISYMIERHETGGNKVNGDYVEVIDDFTRSFNLNVSTDKLTEADGLSFFHVILPRYSKRTDPERLANKIRFSFKKLSPESQEAIREMCFENQKVRDTFLAVVGKKS